MFAFDFDHGEDFNCKERKENLLTTKDTKSTKDGQKNQPSVGFVDTFHDQSRFGDRLFEKRARRG
ncbi:MAG: hypothetical protein FWC35_00905, partial [Proteobacteria bacterium]|nr:hypothetical protein [Pseudomonadota bacterium]